MTPLDMGGNDELRLVLIGRTGSGKSATGNTILGRRHFLSELGASSVTRVCEQGSAELPQDELDEDSSRWKKVLVVDMPGFGDTRSDPDQVQTEIAKCVALSAPGPHAFLLVIQLGRYTEDEDQAAREMLQIFGESALQRHTVLVFTRGDDLEERGNDMEVFLGKNAPEALRSLVEKCGRRYHVLNNKKPENRNQVKELLRKVGRMVEENGGQCYTSALFKKAEIVIREEMMRARRSKKRAEEVLIEEKTERSGKGKSWVQLFRTEAALSPKVIKRIKVLVAAMATGCVVGAVCGAAIPLALTAGVAGTTAVAFGAAIGGVVGGANGVIVGAEAAEPGEAALETLEQVGLMGAAVVGGAAFVGGAYSVGAGLIGAALEGGTVGTAALTGAQAATNAAAAPQALGAAVALAGGFAVKVVKEKVRSASGSTERKSYEVYWNK